MATVRLLDTFRSKDADRTYSLNIFFSVNLPGPRLPIKRQPRAFLLREMEGDERNEEQSAPLQLTQLTKLTQLTDNERREKQCV